MTRPGLGKANEADAAAMKSDSKGSPSASTTDAADVQSMLAERITALEAQIQGSELRTREVAKQHKKALREVQRLAADKTVSPEDRVTAMQARTLAAMNDAWRLEKRVPELEASVDTLTQRVSAQETELVKGASVRERLSALCRELQKQHKEALKDCADQRATEEGKRKAMLDSFNESVASVSSRLDEQAAVIGTQTEENAALKTQLRTLLDTVTASEAHGGHQTKAHDLERQIWEAKMKQQEGIHAQSIERGNLLESKCLALAEDNTTIMGQVDSYRAQFQEFQGTLVKSNEMFAYLKKDSAASRAKEKELMQHVIQLKQQYDQAAKMLLQATEDRRGMQETNAKLTLANTRLQSLCRTLQGQAKAATPQHAAESAPTTAAPPEAGSAPAADSASGIAQASGDVGEVTTDTTEPADAAASSTEQTSE